eukprot:m.435053 g.435053  ORF g.435053 m.435053 type:complete len:74 (-) comp17803_c0_seq1:1554-1775(-)
MVWTESLPALAIITGAIAASGFGLDQLHKFFNNGKPRRWGVDTWDKNMMDRDKRITGSTNEQTSDLDYNTKTQ